MRTRRLHLVLLLIIFALTACTSGAATGQDGTGDVKIILAAYTTPREAYRELIPIFQKLYKDQTGKTVTFEESYQGSGAQSRSVVEGFAADVVALSLEADVTRIQDAGLITHDWHAAPYKGMVSQSIVVFAVRPGNPKGIQDWNDLARADVEVLTPNPKTSGGAMWNILALYGAAERGKVPGVEASQAAAQQLLLSVLNRVTVMDKGARESITNFEKGVADAAITYENEVLVGRQNGQSYDMIIPRSTILIENPLALVDASVEQHGNREAVQAFVDFLFTKQAQEVFAKYGLRSPDPDVAKATAAQYPAVEDLFTIDEFGGWAKATPDFFGDQGIYTLLIPQIQRPGS